MSREATWNNSDGLRVQFGTHSSDNDVAGVHAGSGPKKTMTVLLDLVDVTTAATEANTPIQSAQIKRGSIITDAYVETVIAAVSGGGGTLDIGLWGRGTLATPAIDDADSIAAALTVSRMNTVGEIINLKSDALAGVAIAQLDSGGTTVVGTPVGSVSLSDCVPCFEWDTAVFTAGRILVTIEYIEPSMSAVAAVAL